MRVALPSWAAIFLVAAVAPASAQDRQTFQGTFTTPTSGAPTGLVEAIDYTNPSDPAQKPPAVHRVVIRLHPGARIDTSVPERCTASDADFTARGAAACPEGSLVGHGALDVDTGLVAGPFPRVVETRTTAFNAENALILFVESTNTTPTIRTVARFPVSENTFTAEVPPLPGAPPPDPFLSIKRVRLTLNEVTTGSGSARRAYLTTPPSCPGSWTNVAEFTYRDGVTQVVESASPCTTAQGGSQSGGVRVRVRGVPRSGCVRRDFRARVRVTGGPATTSLYLDNRRIARSGAARFSRRIRVRRLAPGRHTLIAVADANGTPVTARASFRRCGRAAGPRFAG